LDIEGEAVALMMRLTEYHFQMFLSPAKTFLIKVKAFTKFYGAGEGFCHFQQILRENRLKGENSVTIPEHKKLT
jgi:hypothetical protein